jgi:alkylhydroperoxidase family enzyme
MTASKRLIAVLFLMVLVGGTGRAQRVNRARILPVPAAEWTDAHREILGPMARGNSAIDVFTTCLRNMELCRNWMPFTRYILGASNSVAPREKELLILRTSFLCDADYDWAHHVPSAKRAGMSDAEVLRITRGADAPGWSPLDAALIRAADELHRNQHITDRTWTALKEKYSDGQMMDVVFTVGQYTMVSMFLNSAGVQLEPGLTGLPK